MHPKWRYGERRDVPSPARSSCIRSYAPASSRSQASIRFRPAASPPGNPSAPVAGRSSRLTGRSRETQPARRPEVVAAWLGAPRAVIRREHLVVIASGRGHRAGRDDEGAVDEPQVELAREAALALACVRADVRRREHGLGADTARRRHRLRDDVTAANVERPADPPERPVEVGEALVEKGAAACRGAVAGLADPVVVDEERMHVLGRVERGAEHRVVVHAEIAGEEGDGGSHGAHRISTVSSTIIST